MTANDRLQTSNGGATFPKMRKFSVLSLAVGAFFAASPLSPAEAYEPDVKGATVPPEIAQAYHEAAKRAIYVCPRDMIKKTDEDFLKLTEEIKQRFQWDFDAEDDLETAPTTCPSPKSYPDFSTRVKNYKRAVRHLGEIVRSH